MSCLELTHSELKSKFLVLLAMHLTEKGELNIFDQNSIN